MITSSVLVAVYGPAVDENAWAAVMDSACMAYDINTKLRVSAFLAQVGHESGLLRYTGELWGPTAQQLRYERDTSKPWTACDPRNGLAFRLGNDAPGDGKRYKGHGLLQVTGKFNHKALRDRMRKQFGLSVPDFLAYPEQVAEKKWAVLSACDFWATHNLNSLADTMRFTEMTKVINGGYNGLEQRKALWVKARAALGV